MSKHTKGPWTAGPLVDPCEKCDSPQGQVISDGNRYIAEVCRPESVDTAEHDANARLISAAPDLLELVKKEYDYYTSIGRTGEWLDQACAAIEKAEGEAP